MGDSFNKKEREKKKRKKKKEKAERREQKKQEKSAGFTYSYLGHDGQLHETPPDPDKKKKVKAEDIVVGVPPQEKSGKPKFQRDGIVRFFNEEKGYGFIDELDSRESFFVHVNDLQEEIYEKDRVTFEAGQGPKGPVALSVRKAREEEE